VEIQLATPDSPKSLVIAMRELCLAFAVLFLLAGCGKHSAPTAHLAGTVTIKGTPVPSDAHAALSFSSLDGGGSVSVPITSGRYDSPTTPQGSVSVKFYISRPVGPEKVSERTGEKYQDFANLVPPEYAAGLVLEVNGDNVNHDFDL
jgi:hypothetical protein